MSHKVTHIFPIDNDNDLVVGYTINGDRAIGEVFSKNSSTIAICSPNCLQIWKGRDRKTVFCRVRHKKCRAKGETFVCQTLQKTVF